MAGCRRTMLACATTMGTRSPMASTGVARVALLAILVLLLAGCGRRSTVPEWCKGGTLHSSTLREWRLASEANRLATAADFIAAIFKEDRLPMSEIRAKAEHLVQSIEPSASTDQLGSMRTSEVAAGLVVVLGWKR